MTSQEVHHDGKAHRKGSSQGTTDQYGLPTRFLEKTNEVIIEAVVGHYISQTCCIIVLCSVSENTFSVAATIFLSK